MTFLFWKKKTKNLIVVNVNKSKSKCKACINPLRNAVNIVVLKWL